MARCHARSRQTAHSNQAGSIPAVAWPGRRTGPLDGVPEVKPPCTMDGCPHTSMPTDMSVWKACSRGFHRNSRSRMRSWRSSDRNCKVGVGWGEESRAGVTNKGGHHWLLPTALRLPHQAGNAELNTAAHEHLDLEGRPSQAARSEGGLTRWSGSMALAAPGCGALLIAPQVSTVCMSGSASSSCSGVGGGGGRAEGA